MSTKIHRLNITKIRKKDYKKSLMKNMEAFPKKKRKKAAVWGERYKNLSEDENKS